ncbi:hypothetical protein [Clostridium fungisolvens]|uniref:Uncharacterized protein n=1 Tax=Clostridium fungisolvens TaxID=1604897 RepID=A0A6V8SCB4_9CLOT|nr:hypothetical protein [Clostridium fungisolvens]GFP74491.1 hypothetical protein bsdtw1_00543 [Clostridium fungisolvens]
MGCDHDMKKELCEYVLGNTIDIEVKHDDCEIKADVILERKKCVRVWGQVKDNNGMPVKCALIKLLKPVYKFGKVEYAGIAHTVTDCLGFYQFDLCAEEENTKFRILVGKAVYGKERVISGQEKCHYSDDECDCHC